MSSSLVNAGALPSAKTLASLSPMRVGAALAATVAVAYSLCTLAFWLFPEASTNFMNALFHGLDFRMLRSDAVAFTFASFLYGLVVLSVWAFAFGSLFVWLARKVGRMQ